MSLTSKALRQMRIIAVPLTRPSLKATQNPQSNRILTFYQFQISPPPKPIPAGPGPSGDEEKPRPRWRPEGGVAKWVTTKAADTWAGFGRAKGGWKLKVYQGGERLVDRMDFEELALKGIDPSLGPAVVDLESTGNGAVCSPKVTIPLLYPPSINSGSATLEELRALLAYRTPRHRKGFFVWMLIAPLTAPFMIIPVIPNLPFFFCVWRSWSHYKAYRASQYLQSLLDSCALVPEASPSLDVVYKDHTPLAPPSSPPHTTHTDDGTPKHETRPHSGPDTTPPRQQHTVLLTRDAVPAIISLFGLKPTAGADLQRAVEQARVRVKSGRGVL